MTPWECAGSFINRDVRISFAASTSELQTDSSLSASLVLLYFLGDWGGLEALRSSVNRICMSRPLGVVVSGFEAQSVFDLLLDELQYIASNIQIMTKVLSDAGFGSAAESLLTATWPSEDRFDDWMNYSIIVIGRMDTLATDYLHELRSVVTAVGGTHEEGPV